MRSICGCRRAVRRVARTIAVALLGIVLCGYVTKIGFDSMMREIGYGMLLPSGYLPAWPQTLAIPLCFALMTVAYLSYLYSVLTNRRQRAERDAPGVRPRGRNAVLTVIAIGAFALLFLGIPMWMIFMVMAIAAMTWQGVSMEVVVQGLTGTINNLVLLSVPGFIFAGSVMGRGGMATRLINWISAFLGRVPGGMALTTVTAAELFGAISGSSAATVAALGQRALHARLRRLGYDERFSLGLITSSGAIAIIIPPSITMILFSVMTNASVGKLFLAGFIPGIVVGICAAIYCVWYARQAQDFAKAGPGAARRCCAPRARWSGRSARRSSSSAASTAASRRRPKPRCWCRSMPCSSASTSIAS